MITPKYNDFETLAPHQIAPGMRIEIHFLSGPEAGLTMNFEIIEETPKGFITRGSFLLTRAELDHAEIRNLDAIQMAKV